MTPLDMLMNWLLMFSPLMVIDVVAIIVGWRLLSRNGTAGKLLIFAGSLQWMTFVAYYGTMYACVANRGTWLDDLPMNAVDVGFTILQPVYFLLFVLAAVVGRRAIPTRNESKA